MNVNRLRKPGSEAIVFNLDKQSVLKPVFIYVYGDEASCLNDIDGVDEDVVAHNFHEVQFNPVLACF